MALKPILFNTEMVRAILDGRKTVTRRAVKPQPKERGRDKFYLMRNELNGKKGLWAGFFKDSDVFYIDGEKHIDAGYFKAPYQPGDILWVRETWAPLFRDETSDEIVGYLYKANDGKDTVWYDRNYPDGADYTWEGRWRPSIHMPREAARIFLRVTNVRVERLQAITMTDMEAEGVIPKTVTGGQWQQWQEDYMRPVWDSTVKPKDRALYGWDANPWVFVIAFENGDGKDDEP